jgi:hypothetical protein
MKTLTITDYNGLVDTYENFASFVDYQLGDTYFLKISCVDKDCYVPITQVAHFEVAEVL